MDIAHPYADVMPGARGAILAVLVRLERAVTIRELSRQARVSSARATQVVSQLVRSGLVRRQSAGRASLISLNREHLAADEVMGLVRIRGKLIQRLEAELGGWHGLAGAWLFGSAARGDGSPDSDIDLLLVARESIEADVWTDQVSGLADRLRRWTGNDVQLVEHTLDSLRELVRMGNPLVTAIRADGVPLTAHTRSMQHELHPR